MEQRHLKMTESFGVIVVMFLILGTLIIKYKMSPQIPILCVFTLLLFYGRLRGFTWEQVIDGIAEGIKPGIIPMMIFMMIGLLISTWLASGTIATIMVIGFDLVSVKFFIPTVFLACGIVGIIVGNAFTMISTLGLAFMGIGHVLGFSDAMTAGAIVAGGFLGNNLSPLSDTSNLTTSLIGNRVPEHLKNTAKSAIPAAIAAAVIYAVIGFKNINADLSRVDVISSALKSSFHVGAWSLLPILVLLVMSLRQVPAIPTLLAGSFTALVLTKIWTPSLSFAQISSLLMNGFQMHGSKLLDSLMSGGGITHMLNSIALILCALSMGGLLMKYGVVDQLLIALQKLVNTPFKLVLATIVSGVAVNVMIGEEYLSEILPGTAFKSAYEEQQLSQNMLTRSLVAGGADINPLVPWSVSGIFIAGTLSLHDYGYVAFTLYPLLNPLVTLLLAALPKSKKQQATA